MDYKLGLSAECGLDAALPNLNIEEVLNDPAWTFTLKTSCRYWDYRGDREVLGFDPSGRMLYLGKTPAHEDVWIVLAPDECVGPDAEMQAVGKADSPARMDRQSANVMWAFLAYLFSRIRYSDFARRPGHYPDISSERTLALSTDIL